MHVQERFEIVSNGGFFDGGFHRQLWIRPAGPERAKQASYQLVGAEIDAHDATLRGSAENGVLDVGVAPETGALARGNHVIELSYTAKHLFAIYKDSEDLNLDVSGEWPVIIARAAVELNLPEGLPKETGISADTGTSSDPHFDCVETALPTGVRFETTHQLPLGTRLFLSARFPHPGYFVSNVNEEGFRAVLENHPFLVPLLVSICGSIVLFGAGFMVWRRMPRRLWGTSPEPAEVSSAPIFWREVIRAYWFPMVMFALAIVPGLNFTYSGHGGVSWLFAPLCFPWVIVRILIKIAKGSEASQKWYKRFFKLTIPSYIAVALPLSWASATSIHLTFGLPVSAWMFFALMVSPFPWWYFT